MSIFSLDVPQLFWIIAILPKVMKVNCDNNVLIGADYQMSFALVIVVAYNLFAISIVDQR